MGTQTDVETNDASSGARTSTNNTVGKGTRELDEEGSARKVIRTHSTQKEKHRRLDGALPIEDINRKILRPHGASRGDITKTMLLNRLVINP